MNAEEIPTPETDANLWASIVGCIRGKHGEPIENCYVPALVAKSIESRMGLLRDALRRVSAELDLVNPNIYEERAKRIADEALKAIS